MSIMQVGTSNLSGCSGFPSQGADRGGSVYVHHTGTYQSDQRLCCSLSDLCLCCSHMA